MFVLAHGIAIFDAHTSLTRLQTSAPLLAALGAAAGIVTIIHHYFWLLAYLSRHLHFRRLVIHYLTLCSLLLLGGAGSEMPCQS
jgi:hypothetical protein